MTLYSLPVLLGSIFSLVAGCFIYFANRKSQNNISFSLFCFSLFVWLFGYVIAYSIKSEQTALFFCRIACTGAMFTAPAFYHFAVSFTEKRNEFRYVILAYVTMFFIMPLSMTSHLFLRGVYKYYWGYYSKAGYLHPVYLIIFFGIFLRGFYILLIERNKKDVKAIRKIQINYVFIAYVIALLGAIDYIPKYGIEIFPFGFIFEILFVVIVAYAIVTRRLLEIDVIIKKTLIFGSLFTIVFGIFVGVTLLLQQFIAGGRVIGLAVSSILLIFIVRPLEDFLTDITNKYLFQKKSDSRQVVRAFIEYAATVLDSEKIVSETIELSEKAFHPNFLAILLSNSDKYVQYGANVDSTVVYIKNNSQIIDYLKSTKNILSMESETDRNTSEEIKAEMNNLKAVLAVPLILQDELIGIILLGKKKSDEYYTAEDSNMLMDLARTLAIALKNAEFVKERDAMHLEMTQAKLKEELATMAYGMSHQFNNKFQGIAMTVRCAKVLLSQVNIPDELKNKLQAVFDNMTQAEKDALGAGEIAQGLLNFTKPDRLQYDMANITSNIGIVLQLVEYKHPAFKEVEIIKNTEEDLPLTYAHLGYLQEAYFIILDNAYEAIEYMKARNTPNFKGRITISASSDKKNKEIVVSIKDNGVGMKPDVLEKVRNAIPFFTTKGSSGKSGHGAGVNMLSKFIDDFHKGKVTYDSTPDEGTTVSLYIPITEKPKDDDKKEKT